MRFLRLMVVACCSLALAACVTDWFGGGDAAPRSLTEQFLDRIPQLHHQILDDLAVLLNDERLMAAVADDPELGPWVAAEQRRLQLLRILLDLRGDNAAPDAPPPDGAEDE